MIHHIKVQLVIKQGGGGVFNHEEFFEWCRQTAKNGNLVYVSEYNAPEDFELVWQGEVKAGFSSQRKHIAVEKLFKVV